MVTVRKYRRDDAASAIINVYKASAMSVVSELNSTQIAELIEFVSKAVDTELGNVNHAYMQSPNSCFWVAERNHVIVGCVGVRPEIDGRLEITKLSVYPSIQRKGIATQLMDKAEAFCRQSGYSQVHLWVSDHAKGAIALYEQRGYQQTDTESSYLSGLMVREYTLTLN